MKPTIYLSFVDDWELSDNGSGDLEELHLRYLDALNYYYELLPALSKSRGQRHRLLFSYFRKWLTSC